MAELLRDADGSVREAAAEALQSVGADTAVRPTAEVLVSHATDLRNEMQALGQMHDDSMAHTLFVCSTLQNPIGIRAMASVLGSLGPHGTEVAAELLKHHD